MEGHGGQDLSCTGSCLQGWRTWKRPPTLNIYASSCTAVLETFLELEFPRTSKMPFCMKSRTDLKDTSTARVTRESTLVKIAHSLANKLFCSVSFYLDIEPKTMFLTSEEKKMTANINLSLKRGNGANIGCRLLGEDK